MGGFGCRTGSLNPESVVLDSSVKTPNLTLTTQGKFEGWINGSWIFCQTKPWLLNSPLKPWVAGLPNWQLEPQVNGSWILVQTKSWLQTNSLSLSVRQLWAFTQAHSMFEPWNFCQTKPWLLNWQFKPYASGSWFFCKTKSQFNSIKIESLPLVAG